ncbi:hypothetical protein [Vibrio sp. WXL210]|uniref:hypothetical protein n=1 Tax=Vibrio sp. WXL210 TaxID=3450709 RepID=UPI003EC59117
MTGRYDIELTQQGIETLNDYKIELIGLYSTVLLPEQLKKLIIELDQRYTEHLLESVSITSSCHSSIDDKYRCIHVLLGTIKANWGSTH